MITINKINYILADDIITTCPIWCKGVRNGRELVKKKTIERKNYIFARNTDDGWVENDGKSVKFDKILVKKAYIDKCEQYTNEKNDKNVVDEKGIEKAPPILQLDDDDKFKDDKGNPLEIETRGTRVHNNVFFKVNDVSLGFGLKNLYKVVIDDRHDHTYKKDIDYKYFNCLNSVRNENKTSNKNGTKKELFLTYVGMLRVLFVSRSICTDRFVKWATETLFAAQMGTIEQKQDLTSKILGVSSNHIKEVLGTSSNSIPCIYLFTLNTVKNLRDKMNIHTDYADDMVVCKYGFTCDLERRTKEHAKAFKIIGNVNLKLKIFSYIDPMYTSNAETDMKHYFEMLKAKFNYDKYDELIIIKPSQIKNIEIQYKSLGNSYGGFIKTMIDNEKTLRNEINILKKDNEIAMLKKNNEIDMLKKDSELDHLKMNNEISLLKKEIERLKKQQNKTKTRK